jgi:Zn-finger nucleic acid-binding protein
MPDSVDLAWVVDAAAEVARVRGPALFRQRTLGLRVPMICGLLAIGLARLLAAHRAIALAALATGVLPAVCAAPGITAATLAAARGRDPEGSPFFLENLHRVPAYAAMAIVRYVVLQPLMLVFPIGIWLDFRLTLAGFALVDGEGPIGSLRTAFRLTRDTAIKQFWLRLAESLDGLARYGIRAELDGRVRNAIGQAMIYDYLLRREQALATGAPVPTVGAPPMASSSSSAGPDGGAGAPANAPPVAVRDAAPPPRVIDPSAPACPRCGTLIAGADREGLVFGRCPACGGVWLDNEQSRKVAEGRLATPVLVAARQEPLAPVAPDEGPRIQCPLCGASMQRAFVPAARLHVDVCARHGTWFDRGELERAHAAFVQSQQDRAYVARVAANAPRDATSIYLQGPGGMARAAGSAIKEAAVRGTKFSVDAILEGTEQERDAMVERAAFTAVEILLGGSSKKDD